MLSCLGTEQKVGDEEGGARSGFQSCLGTSLQLMLIGLQLEQSKRLGTAIDPMFEMTWMKGIEMFAEAIPGVIIQLMAIATSDKDVGTSAWLSLLQCQQLQQALPLQQLVMTGTQTLLRERIGTRLLWVYTSKSKQENSSICFHDALDSRDASNKVYMTIVLLGLMGGSWAFSTLELTLACTCWLRY